MLYWYSQHCTATFLHTVLYYYTITYCTVLLHYYTLYYYTITYCTVLLHYYILYCTTTLFVVSVYTLLYIYSAGQSTVLTTLKPSDSTSRTILNEDRESTWWIVLAIACGFCSPLLIFWLAVKGIQLKRYVKLKMN